ncbi:CapA family protein [Streptomyces sp. BE133]|uniref:CapA family protein n=1 Tax=Streptomyces sp. BE133 TaxID=3002523 RepID=UPI002E767188|nr:CapA family protein [Streptomyces sp. BE133]MEE1812801.1 CapA family protein [Streptomyces sp. BE133]
MHDGAVTLFLGGDVMLGRGVDQILPHPADPALREAYIRDARAYVDLAEAASGPIPRPVDFRWPWGVALLVLDDAAPDVRVVNLETAVTSDGDFAPDKSVHYRMSPANLPCLAAARPDVCALANNHALDFGPRGLHETLDALAEAGLRTAGAGRDQVRARQPAIVPLGAGGRVLVFSFGMPSSGIPKDWAATGQRAGVNVLAEPSTAAAAAFADRLRQVRQQGDITVASVHWGSNWGYDVSRCEVRFAHALLDAGVDVVHGHSSHHPRPLEVYRDRLILYGCGDLIDDYEGIGGYESYRDDLRVLYLVSVEADTGRLIDARMVPLQARRMRLEHASPEDTEWLRAVLDRHSREFGTRVDGGPDGTLTLRPLRAGQHT